MSKNNEDTFDKKCKECGSENTDFSGSVSFFPNGVGKTGASITYSVECMDCNTTSVTTESKNE